MRNTPDKTTGIEQSHHARTISVVIPTLNEINSIGETLGAVGRGLFEVIVADGGSGDGTAEAARQWGARVITAERGRGSQMHAGACAARGEIFWFLHADTRPPRDAATRIVEVFNNKNAVAGNFEIHFDGESAAARFLSWLYPQLRRIGLCYGDSAIFVRRDVYERIGGFQSFPIFEDLDLVRRLRKEGRIVHLPVSVTTSSRRFEGRSFAFTFARWALLQTLYWMGVHPRRLVRLYAPIRAARLKPDKHKGLS
ncbi:MAG TPA: TIGR04283 family arsenosugar biosynthesis glycosyltransferase [Pyrinomonadaceae bacterium]|nr:TIGR04283 family arsenosugar biosynthesis glycosyltransferase [Pyrinomonadaceae bacterium]